MIKKILQRRARPNPFSLSQTIAERIKQVEAAHNLTPVEALYSQAQLGFELSPDLDQQNLEPLARQYEVNLDWLMTGRGRVRQIHPMRAGWSPCTMIQSVAKLWQQGEFRAVEMITNRREPSISGYSPVTIVVARVHPQLGDPYRVFETWAAVRWDSAGRVVPLTMIKTLLELQARTGDSRFSPRGHSLGSVFYSAWEDGMILPVDLIAKTPPGWNPEATLQARHHDLADPVLLSLADAVCSVPWLLDVFEQTVATANN
jgi:hypothetical protein